MRSGLRVVACGALALSVGCSTSPQVQPGDTASADSVPSAVTAAVASATTGTQAGADDAPQADETPLADASMSASVPVRIARLRSGDAGGPFGQPDLWIGAGPPTVGLQRSLGVGDIPGPLMDIPYGGVSLFRVYDMCGYSQHGIRQDGDFDSVVYRFGADQAQRMWKNCLDHRFLAIARSPWIEERNSYFRWRNQAETWMADRRARHAISDERFWRDRTGLPKTFYWTGFGVDDSDSFGRSEPFGIVHAPRFAAVDELRVEPGSVLVRDGVLRGLVRNWSWRYWAYGVTVTAGGRSFEWPLSVQPGEVAPFEIHDWDGLTDPQQIQISVTADLSWHADPSRAFQSYTGGIDLGWSGTLRVMETDMRQRYPAVTADISSSSRTGLSASWGGLVHKVPQARPSWTEGVAGLVVEDLRGYGVVTDGHGRIVDVGPATIYGFGWDEESEKSGFVRANRWPYWDPAEDALGMSLRLDIHAQLPHDGRNWGDSDGDLSAEVYYLDREEGVQWGTLHGAIILWVGAAHPSRPVS